MHTKRSGRADKGTPHSWKKQAVFAEKFIKDQWENGDSATRESLAKELRFYAMDNPDKESNDKPSNANFKASILCPRKSQVSCSLSLDA